MSPADGRHGNQPRWREQVRVELAAVLDHSAQHSWLVMEKPRAGEVRELNDVLGTDADRSCGVHLRMPRPL